MDGDNLYSPNAEQALLGALIINPAAVGELNITAEAFYVERHQMIYRVIYDLYRAHVDPDYITIAAELDKRGQLGEIGGPAALTALITTPDISSMGSYSYAQIILDRAARRRMMKIAQDVANGAISGANVDDVTAKAALALTNISQTSMETTHWGRYLDEASAFVDERANNPGETWGIPTGILDYDKETGGIQPGELVIISGEPGIGKSFLTLQMCMSMAETRPGCLYSLEMLGRSVGLRALSIKSGVSTSKMRKGQLDGQDYELYYKTLEQLYTLPIYMTDREGWTLAGLRTDLIRRTRDNVGWFLVDYSYMLSDGVDLSDNERTMLISSGMKRICKATGMGGILIHSMNKAGMADQRAGSSQAGLRGSAQMAYDADVILFLAQSDPLNNIVTAYFKKGREIENPRKFFELRRVGAKFQPMMRPKV